MNDINTRLVINPITRTIAPKYRNQKAVYVAKNDHNSVLICFELPRYVDGYDMSAEENVIHIHYANVDEKDMSKYSNGVSDAVNVEVDTDEVTQEEVVSFCWLVPKTATRYAGVVSVGITFERYDNVDGKAQEVYSWSTAPYGKTVVWDSMDNSIEVVEREYNYLVETCNAIVATALRGDFYYLVEEALREAKASGEFDGEKGDKGDKGEKGDKGDSVTDYNLVAGALKGSALGEKIYLDDISPLTHELSVKLSSDSVTDFSNVRLRTFKSKGKNLFDVSKIITTASLKDPAVVQLTNNNDGSLTVSAYGISSIVRYDDDSWRYVTLREIAPLLEVDKSYYMSAKTNGKKFITLGCYDETRPENDCIRCVAHWFFDSRGLVVNNINNHPITDELLDCGVFFYNDYSNGVDEATISDIQMELITNEEHIEKLGYAPTNYELYQNDFVEYNANIDGTVEGVISTHPTMYIETDTKEVYISVVYNEDSNKVVAKIYADVDTKLKEKVSKDYVNDNFVGRLKGTVSGQNCITMRAVAEPEHSVKIRVSSDTVEDLTSVKLTRCGKNAFDVSKVRSTDGIKISDGSLTFSKYGAIAGTLKDIAPMLQIGKTYRLSMKTDGKNFIVIGIYTWFANSRGLSYGSDNNLPITEEMLSERVYFYNNGGSSTCTVSDIQIELNDAENPAEFVATEYEPFNHNVEEYIPNNDGTVEGVKSLYPTTVIYSDKKGVEITADYNIDINSINFNNTPIDKPTTLAGYGITDAYTTTQIDSKITESETAMSTLMDEKITESETAVSDLMDEKIAEIPTASVRKFKILLNADGWFSEPSEGGETPDELLGYFDIAHAKYEYLDILYTDEGVDMINDEYVFGGNPERAVFVKLASSYEGIPTTHEQRRAYDEIKLHTIVKGYTGLNENYEQTYDYYLGIGIMGDTKPTVDIPIEVIII